jgi:hypothetical protein
MTREQAIDLAKKYDGKCDDIYIDWLCNYINISRNEFWRVIDKYVNKELFYRNKKVGQRWIPKFEVGTNFE